MTWLHRVNILKFDPVTPEFKTVKGVRPLVDQQFGYIRLAAPLLDLAGSVLSFLGRSLLSCFTYTLEGTTAMPRGLQYALPRISSLFRFIFF